MYIYRIYTTLVYTSTIEPRVVHKASCWMAATSAAIFTYCEKKVFASLETCYILTYKKSQRMGKGRKEVKVGLGSSLCFFKTFLIIPVVLDAGPKLEF